MKVYVLTADTYDEGYGSTIVLLGVFSTEEKARKKANEKKLACYDISPVNIDENEEPEQALLREVLEETGLHVTVEPLDPFVAEDGEYIVYCYMIQLDDKVHEQIAEEETGVIRIASRLQLIKSSPYADYNERAFEWFGV